MQVVLVLLYSSNNILAVWEKFDLVRPFKGHGSEGTTPYLKIDQLTENGPNLTDSSNFGFSVANAGDIDGNGVDDIVVGAIGEDVDYNDGSDLQRNAGGIYILFMDIEGGLINNTHINAVENNGPQTFTNDQFGYSVAGIGDLDADGVPDLIVGAPGDDIASVYVLYMLRNGTVRENVLIRGEFVTSSEPGNSTLSNRTSDYIPNGPPTRYQGRLGSALALVGDIDGDGVPEVAVSSLDQGGGRSTVHVMFMQRNGTVSKYSTFGGAGVGGGPKIPESFTGFGSSIVALPDKNGNGVPELVIGAKDYSDPGTPNVRSGKSFVCFLDEEGFVLKSTEIGEFSIGDDMPVVTNDECGTGVATIGDINKDDFRQRHRGQKKKPSRDPIDDYILGCPQTNAGNKPGHIFLMMLDTDGELAGFTEIPAATDKGIGPPLKALDRFGQSVAGYWDIDDNNFPEILVGAPGDDDGDQDSGAIYILFIRSRRHHPPDFPLLEFVLMITLPTCCFCTTVIVGTAYFFYYFRRKPDEVELIVNKAGFELAKKRVPYQKTSKVYCDEYTV